MIYSWLQTGCWKWMSSWTWRNANKFMQLNLIVSSLLDSTPPLVFVFPCNRHIRRFMSLSSIGITPPPPIIQSLMSSIWNNAGRVKWWWWKTQFTICILAIKEGIKLPVPSSISPLDNNKNNEIIIIKHWHPPPPGRIYSHWQLKLHTMPIIHIYPPPSLPGMVLRSRTETIPSTNHD